MSVQALVSNRSFLTLLFGALLLLPAFANQYTLFVGNLMMLYIILASGLNILVGFAGQLSLAQYAIAGLGALLAAKLSGPLPMELAIVGGVLLAIPAGLVFAVPALRTRGVNLAVVTLGMGFAVQEVIERSFSLRHSSSASRRSASAGSSRPA